MADPRIEKLEQGLEQVLKEQQRARGVQQRAVAVRRKIDIGIALTAVGMLIGFGYWCGTLSADVANTKDQVNKLDPHQIEKEKDSALGEIRNAVARLAVPVGTVVAWPRESPPDETWAFCAGQPFAPDWNKAALVLALDAQVYGTERLPDYRGYFLRGADDPDGSGPFPAATRDSEATVRSHAHGGQGSRIGSVQGFATGHPQQGMGAAYHVGNNADNYSPPGDGTTYFAISGGPHVIAWDAETRPINAYVNWIIKVK